MELIVAIIALIKVRSPTHARASGCSPADLEHRPTVRNQCRPVQSVGLDPLQPSAGAGNVGPRALFHSGAGL